MCTFYQVLYASIYVSIPAQPAPLTSEAVLQSLTSRPADVVAPSTSRNALVDSVVGSSSPPFLTVSRSFSADISSVSFPVDSAALPSTTDQTQPPSSRSTTIPPATDQPPPPASGLNSGGIVAIVIMVLALVVSVTVAVGLIVCFIRRHRHHQFRPKRANEFPAIGMCVQ